MTMTDPGQGEPIKPEQDRTEQIINSAKANRLAIRCIGAAGEQTDLIHSGVNDLWIVHRRLRDQTDTWVADNRVNDSLRNIIEQCRPDVTLIEISDSMGGNA